MHAGQGLYLQVISFIRATGMEGKIDKFGGLQAIFRSSEEVATNAKCNLGTTA